MAKLMTETNHVGLLGYAEKVKDVVNGIHGNGVAASNRKLMFEDNFEQAVTQSFVHDTVLSILNSTGLGIKRIAFQKIAQVTMEVLKKKRVESVELINLYDLVNEVYESISHYPTVTKVCGDKSNRAQFSKKQVDRELFLAGLALYVGRQVLVVKHLTGNMVNDKVNIATKRFLHRYNATRSLFAAIHQAANKFKEGGMSPNELKDIVKVIAEKDHERLGSFVKSTFTPHLQDYYTNIVQAIEENSRTYIDDGLDDILGNRLIREKDFGVFSFEQ